MEKKQPIKHETLKAWENRAKEVYKESVKIMREGIHGIEVIAEKTMEATRLRLSNQKAMSRIKSHFSDLGHMVYDGVGGKDEGQLSITSAMKLMMKEVRELQEKIQKNLDSLRHLSTVSEVSSTKQAKENQKVSNGPTPKKGGKGRSKKTS